MPKFDFKEFYESLEKLTSPEAVDEAFKPLLAFSPVDRAIIGKDLEGKFLTDIEEIKNAVVEQGPAAIKKIIAEKIFDFVNAEAGKSVSEQQGISLAQKSVQINSYTERLGADLSPLTKAYNAAAANLTDAEYNSPDVLVKPVLAVIDAIAVQEGLYKPNPLRRDNKNRPRI